MHFIYHPKHEAQVVPTLEYHKYLSEGWYDTPAKFPKQVKKNKIVLCETEKNDSKDESSFEDLEVKTPSGRPQKLKDEKLETNDSSGPDN